MFFFLMIRRPPRSTRTDTLLPYTTLFRSVESSVLPSLAKEPILGTMSENIRLDKWLWAARFYKTRSLAAQEIGKGRVVVNGQPSKPARDIAVGDLVSIRRDQSTTEVRVQGLSRVRGPAPVARALYEETPEIGRANV